MTTVIGYSEYVTSVNRFYDSGLHEHFDSWHAFLSSEPSGAPIQHPDSATFVLTESAARKMRMLNSPHFRTLVRVWLINWMEEKHGCRTAI